MKHDDIRSRILAVFRDLEITGDVVPDEANLAADYDIDSTEMVEIVVRLELEFSARLSPATEKAETFGDLVASVAGQFPVEV